MHIMAPTGYHIVLTIVDFSIEALYADIFYIKSADETPITESLVLTGVQVPDIIYTDSDQVWIGFNNDDYAVGFEKGFEIELSSIHENGK